MRSTAAGFVILAVLIANGARAQIGKAPSECLKQWGDPVAGKVDADGAGILRFKEKELSIEMEFVSGMAERAVFQASSLDDDVVNNILGANSDGMEWCNYEQPGRPAVTNGTRQWMRYDEAAMARLAPGVLTIMGSQWYPHQTELLAKKAATASANVEDVVSDTAPQPSGPDELIGFWRGSRPEAGAVVLEIRAGGDVTWIVCGDTEQRSLKAGWKRETTDEQAMYTFAGTQSESGAPPPIIGRGRLESQTELRFEGDRAAAGQWNVSATMDFERVSSMPPWKPKAPAVLPVKGDSMDDAIRLLGPPMGNMTSGGRQVLMYPWGNIWVVNGTVAGID